MHPPFPVRLVLGNETEAHGRVALASRHSGLEQVLPVTSAEAERTITEALRHLAIPFKTEKIGARPPRGSTSTDGSAIRDSLRRIYDQVPGAAWVAPSSLRTAGARSSLEGKSVLIALEESSLEACLRFGILTGRPILALASRDELSQLWPALRGASSAFVSPPSDYTLAELEALLQARNVHAPRLPVGFFYPMGERVAESFALKCFVHSLASDHPPGPYTFALPLARETRLEEVHGLNLLSGSQIAFSETVRVLEQPARLLFIAAHSNGVDMNLGRTVLCARKGWECEAMPAEAMPCFGADVCCRKNESNALYGVSRIRSEVVFLNACYAASFAGAFYSPEATLAAQFARSPYVRFLWATYSGPIYDPYSGILAAQMLADGRTAGEITLEINRAHFERYRDFADSTILFGDPEAAYAPHALELPHGSVLSGLAVELHAGRAASARGDEEPSSKPQLESSFFDALQYHRALRCIAQATQVGTLVTQGNALLSAVEAVQFFAIGFNAAVGRQSLDEAQYGRIIHELAQHLGRLHRAVVDLFLSTVRLRRIPALFRVGMDNLFQTIEGVASDRTPCVYCGQSSVKRIGPQKMPGVSVVRLVRDCLNCGPVEDLVGDIQGGRIVEPDAIGSSSKVQIVVEVDVGERGLSYVSVCVALDPRFDPIDGRSDGEDRSRIPVARAEGFAEPDGDGRIRVALPDVELDGSYEPGRYFLNAAILVNSEFALLRRCISVA